MEQPVTRSQAKVKTLILGKEGMLAHALETIFSRSNIDYQVLGRPEFDILRNETSEIDIAAYDYIVNAIGLTNRWEQKRPSTEFVKINTEFPLQLAELSQQTNTQLIHISTDCVFSGKSGPYSETSPCDASSIYGRSKLEGEPGDKALVIRTSIIGPEIKNRHALLSWIQSNLGDTLPGYTNHWWNGVTTYELAHFITAFIQQGQRLIGVRHLASPQYVTKADLIRLILDAMNEKQTQVEPAEAEDYIDRRLTTNHPEFQNIYTIRPLAQQLSEMMTLIKAA